MSDDEQGGFKPPPELTPEQRAAKHRRPQEGAAPGPEITPEELSALVFNPDKMPAKGIDRLVGQEIAKGFVSVLSGYGGLGKSSLLYALACGMAQGHKLVGNPVHQQTRVLYLQLEDDQDMVDRALAGVAKEHVLHRIPIQDRLLALGRDTAEEVLRVPLQYLQPDSVNGTPQVNGQLRRRLGELIKAYEADVLVADPLAVFYGGMQMTNEATNVLARDLAAIARECDIAVIATSHQRKPANAGNHQATQHDVKHGAELVDTARSVWNLMPLSSQAVAEWSAQVDREELEEVRQCIVTKTNIGRTGARYFFRLKEVEVHCGDGRSESVAAVTAWEPPHQQTTAEPWMMEALVPILEGEWIVMKKSGRSTKRSLIDVLLTLSDDINASKVAEAMRDKGWVKEVEERDPRSRKMARRCAIGDRWPDDAGEAL